ncbi:hypothetical protein N657DRAFT_572942 [Parathielavia appendiculata]|uniref:Serine-rich protein n=1 Tax=Parathielavia appendiculata TaxID=2587402 RepID=A0AAN6U0K5_9PEZI|nr:hypothetical protein N657DRAFT_572942 [Parathielavia appendiculata]
MPGPPDRHGPTTTLHERSNSQNNKPGIRLVPYSPPRLDPENRAASQASSRENAGSRCSGNYDDKTGGNAEHSRRPSWRDEVTEGRVGSLGLPSPTAPAFSLAKSRDPRVSGVKPRASPSDLSPAGPTTPHLSSASEVPANIASHNVSEPRRSRADDTPSPASATAQRPRSLSRRRNLRLAVHPNGTFSLVPEEPQSGVSDGSLTSPNPSYASRTPSAQDRPSTDTWSDHRASTPLTGASTVILDQSFSELEKLPYSTSSSRRSSTTQLAEDPTSSSPWNYRLVGGLRKVPATPDTKGRQPLYSSSTSTSETQLAPLPEASTAIDDEEQENAPTRAVIPKTSLTSVASNQTIETVSEATNYKVYGRGSVAQESSDSLVFNSPGPSNWEVLGQSSPATAYPSSPATVSLGGNENYVLHGAPSVSPSSSLVTISKQPRPVYSQESLVVAPLRPAKKRSHERFGYYKQRSRETLRSRTGSVQSLKSLSSVIASQDPAQALLTTPVVLNLGGSATQRFPWSVPQRSGSSSSNPQGAIAFRPPAPMLPFQPHQWSSQLSTVMSESEGGSDLARSVSPLSDGSGHHRRQSSTGWVGSMHSRQMASISSSIAGQLEEAAGPSGSDSLEKPQPSYARAGPSQIRMVRDQDEHGDGLADLEHRPSKTGLAALFNNSSSWNLHSNASSRTNSFTSSIPAWARVYYGSGERRFLGRRPSFLTISDGGDSRPPSSYLPGSRSGSPNSDNFPQAIFSPRKRAREIQPTTIQQSAPEEASMEISPAPSQGQDYRSFRAPKQKTSSIWSPHLQVDRRATGYSVWDPPSVSWSADSGVLGKRNVQVILFTLGFLLPFAWMVAAFLPLPPIPELHMSDVENNGPAPSASKYRKYVMEETRYESARWWRNLNRVMSFIGLLIIGAVVALGVVGGRQGWARR